LNRGAQLTELLKQKQFVHIINNIGPNGCWRASLCNFFRCERLLR
jgi:hypothetical protein